MTSYFPDLNVWVALSVTGHAHHAAAWTWFQGLPDANSAYLCRFTQLGLLRLLTNQAAMGEEVFAAAWRSYDVWAGDPRVSIIAEPENLGLAFRRVTQPFAAKPASKWIGDCYLLAFAMCAGATLVTFDRALARLADEQGCRAVIPS
jgi:toxin-antitoxin system PIN domain toxin